jgi:hypothetical protein
MTEENSRQNNKQFYYESPSKQAMMTPIRSAFKSTNYNVGAFLEKIEELNRIKEKIKESGLKAKRPEGEENRQREEL